MGGTIRTLVSQTELKGKQEGSQLSTHDCGLFGTSATNAFQPLWTVSSLKPGVKTNPSLIFLPSGILTQQ